MPADPEVSTGGLLLALTNPLPGREDEYNAWYTERHVHDALALPGFLDAQRFQLVHGDDPTHRYLALYHLSDVEEASTAMRTAQRQRDDAGRADDPSAFFHVPKVVDPAHRGWWMRPITPVLRAR